ncbi:unnamed protein product [Pleuronectes platessa]|uniref:Uncharacterized protein n=1 Tax=Pleuronectes platessa TaxID=8262 RepID=A0A9N7YGN8_PLEPL|nr:unnamed protein product [Pleuronectes platessa]
MGGRTVWHGSEAVDGEGLSALTKRKPSGPRDRSRGATEVTPRPLAAAYSPPFTSLCVHKEELIRVPGPLPFTTSTSTPPPLPLVMRRSRVLPPRNKKPASIAKQSQQARKERASRTKPEEGG